MWSELIFAFHDQFTDSLLPLNMNVNAMWKSCANCDSMRYALKKIKMKDDSRQSFISLLLIFICGRLTEKETSIPINIKFNAWLHRNEHNWLIKMIFLTKHWTSSWLKPEPKKKTDPTKPYQCQTSSDRMCKRFDVVSLLLCTDWVRACINYLSKLVSTFRLEWKNVLECWWQAKNLQL